MNNSLDKARFIDSARLDSEHYFQSLLEEAYTAGLLCERDIERIESECIALLAERTERYNGGDSSSIRVEKAQDILSSLLFTIGLALKDCPAPDEAAAALQKSALSELYKKGRVRIDSLLAETRAAHSRLLANLIDTPNLFYRDTLQGGIPGFFKLYYPDYAAHEIHITADYPLFNSGPRLLGIEFIKAYVEAASCENELCGLFSAGDIHRLLRAYAGDYRELPVNIYEQVLTAAIGCVLAGADPSRLDVTEGGVRYLCLTLAGVSKAEVLTEISEAAAELNHRFPFSRELSRYIKGSLPIIAGVIELAARGGKLERVFYTPAPL